MANLEKELVRLERQLCNATWQPGSYTVIEIQDPKPRRVSAAPFRDTVVHHALCNVVAAAWRGARWFFAFPCSALQVNDQ